MPTAIAILLEINTDAIKWAETHYPEFIDQTLGEKRRTTYLLSRALLLHTLQNNFDASLTTIPECIYNAHKKPVFKAYPVSFNITHSSRFIGLIMVSGDAPIGIDIETIKVRKNFDGLLQRSFKEGEISWILAQNTLALDVKNHRLSKEEMVRFFLLWSAKEAYLKADGRGFQGLNSLVLDPDNNIMQGDLKEGILFISTLPLNKETEHSSFALYLPAQYENALKLQYLSIKDDQVRNIAHNLQWQLCLQEN